MVLKQKLKTRAVSTESRGVQSRQVVLLPWWMVTLNHRAATSPHTLSSSPHAPQHLGSFGHGQRIIAQPWTVTEPDAEELSNSQQLKAGEPLLHCTTHEFSFPHVLQLDSINPASKLTFQQRGLPNTPL